MNNEATQEPKSFLTRALTTFMQQFSSHYPVTNSGRLKALAVLFAVVMVVMYALALPLSRENWELGFCSQFKVAAIPTLTATSCSYGMLALDVLYITVFVLAAALMFLRRGNDRVALVGAVALVAFGAVTPPPLLVFSYVYPQFDPIIGSVTAIGMYLFVLFFFTFPNGLFVPGWLRWARYAVGLTFFALWVSWLGKDDTFALFPDLTLILGWSAVGVWAQIYRYQHIATPDQRQQTKWVVFGGALSLLLYVLAIAGQVWTLTMADGDTSRALLDLGHWLLRYGSLMLIPVTIAVSILRFRLWGIDTMISRALVYGISSVVLAVVFMMTIVLVQQVGFAFSGGENPSVAVAAAALIVAGLFQPTRMRLKRVIERRISPSYIKRAMTFSATPGTAESPATGDGVSPMVGQKIGHYTVTRTIGRGGMADVYLGQHSTLNRAVAIKVLTPIAQEPEELRQRFEREANLVASLRHDNIVQIFDFGKYGDQYYMVMEYIPGPDLLRFLRLNGRFTLDSVLPLLNDIASALDYAHDRGVVHRDIKPSNVLLRPDESGDGFRAVLGDFGLAKALDGAEGFTRSGTIGTLDYIAPEQIISSRTVDPRADIYSFGVLAYQMLTGELPFKGENMIAILKGHLEKPAPNPRQVAPELPEEAAKAIMRALSKDPDNRPQRASAFIEQLTNQ
jgi:hypothetical protein